MLRISIITLLFCLSYLQPLLAQYVSVFSGVTNISLSTLYGGGRAIDTPLWGPETIAVDTLGNVYISSSLQNLILKVDTNKKIYIVAGSSQNMGFSGDGGLANAAKLNSPTGVSLDKYGNVFFSDRNNHRIRKVSPTGIITTVAGNGNTNTNGQSSFSGDLGPAIHAQLNNPEGTAVDTLGNIYLSDSGNHRIRKITTDGKISTVAGNSVPGFYGDGQQAIDAQINSPTALVLSSDNSIYFTDTGNNRIRKIDKNGVISTVVGGGNVIVPTNGTTADQLLLNAPKGLALDLNGNLTVSDSIDGRIIKLAPTGSIATLIHHTKNAVYGDNGTLANAGTYKPLGLAINHNDELLFAEYNSNTVRIVTKFLDGQCANVFDTSGLVSTTNVKLCNTGEIQNLRNNTQRWLWSCSGINGGENVDTCDALRYFNLFTIVNNPANGTLTCRQVTTNYSTTYCKFKAEPGFVPIFSNNCGAEISSPDAFPNMISIGNITSDCTISLALEKIENGSCGSNHTVPSLVAPNSNLCSIGEPSTVVNTFATSWTWSCQGIHGGANQICNSPKLFSIHSQVKPSLESGKVSCNSPVEFGTTTVCNANPEPGFVLQEWQGDCIGTTECILENVTSSKYVTAIFKPVLTHGICGTAVSTPTTNTPTANLCASGIPSVVQGNGPWSWTCFGVHAGTPSTCKAIVADSTPANFSFPTTSNVERNTWINSSAITLTDFNVPAQIVVLNGYYSIGCNGVFTSENGFLQPGQSICLSHKSSTHLSSAVLTTVIIGGVGGSFFSETRAPNTEPNSDEDNDGIPYAIEIIEGRNPALKDNEIFNSSSNVSNRLFVMQQYRDFLSREGDSAGILDWTLQLNKAKTKSQVVRGFYDSSEFQTKFAPLVRLYLAYFGRFPDYEGLIYWVKQRQTGMDIATISQSFATSSEFTSRYGSLSNAQFLAFCYQNVLKRKPDQIGFNYWLEKLNFKELTIGQVMLMFAESSEYQIYSYNQVAVSMAYIGLLRRSPELAGYNHWQSYLLSGLDLNNLLEEFIQSKEYWNRFLD